MQNRTVAAIWAVGLALALLIYAVGPDDALATLFDWADAAGALLQHAIATLGGRAFDILRALAIACFVIFFALCTIAAGRGRPAPWLMLSVTVLFLLLVWHQGRAATGHWTLAFVLTAAAALNMTRRLG